MLKRQAVDPEKLKWLREQKESVGEWLMDKANEDEDQKVRKSMRGMLNKMTMDSIKELKPQLVKLAADKELAEFLCDELVKKAWKEIKYRNCYSQVVKAVITKSFSWEEEMEAKKNEAAEAKQDPAKKSKRKSRKFKPSYLKKRILKVLENEYSNGFKNYQEFRKVTQADPELTKEDKVDKILKKRDGLYGNVLFMSELFVNDVVSINTLKTIVMHGIISVVQSYVQLKTDPDMEARKETKAIFIDYVEALLKFWQEAGQAYEKKRNHEVSKQRKKDKEGKKIKNRLDPSIDKEMTEQLISFMKNEKFGWDENVKNDKEMKNKFYCIDHMLNMFATIVEHIKHQDLDVRMDSLIENFQHLRRTGWKRIFTRQKASESKRDVAKQIRKEKEEEDRLIHRSRRERYGGRSNYDDYRRNDRGDRNRRRNERDNYRERDRGRDRDRGRNDRDRDFNYNDYEDEQEDAFDQYQSKRGDNEDFRKKDSQKRSYVEVKKGKSFMSAGQRFTKCEKFLKDQYKEKTWDGEAFQRIWELEPETAEQQSEIVAKYLSLFMRNCKDSDFDDRVQVIKTWTETEAITVEHFAAGFNLAQSTIIQEASDTPKIYKGIFEIVTLMVQNLGYSLSSVTVEYKDKEGNLMDFDDAEDIFFFYNALIKKFKVYLESVEDVESREKILGMLDDLAKRCQDNMPDEV